MNQEPRQLPEWLQLEIDRYEDARRRAARGRLLIALAVGLGAAALLWSVGAYDGIWHGTPMGANL